MNQYLLGIPGHYPMWPFPPSYTPEVLKRNKSPDMIHHPSSDDSDGRALHPFDTIEDVLTVLERHPDASGRDFDEFRAMFKKNGVHWVHELDKIPEEKFTSLFGLNWGDSCFLHRHITKSIRDTKALREGEKVAKRQRTK